jgi:hypothetical protein
VWAVNGIAVAANYSSGKAGLHVNGDEGDIVAYFIRDSKVTSKKTLFKGKAREVVINPTGTACAFRKNAGSGKGVIALADIATGKVTDLVTDNDVDGTLMNLGRLAWPDGDWVYFQLGWPVYDKEDFRGGNKIWRVNVATKSVEHWHTFSHAPWYWCLSRDMTRMVVRYMDDGSAPWGQNMKLNLKNGKPTVTDLEKLYNDKWAKYGSLGGYGCGAGLSPSGTYVMNFTSGGHNSWHIRKWSDNSVVSTMSVRTFDGWGGKALGGGNFGNKWSANSDDWIVIRQQGKQVLLNWPGEKRIVVTESGSVYSETGDFWEGDPPTAISDAAVSKRSVRHTRFSSRVGCTAYTIDGRRMLHSSPTGVVLLGTPAGFLMRTVEVK